MEDAEPLPDLWAGIEGFDEEKADGALVGLLWDVPLPEALAGTVNPSSNSWVTAGRTALSPSRTSTSPADCYDGA